MKNIMLQMSVDIELEDDEEVSYDTIWTALRKAYPESSDLVDAISVDTAFDEDFDIVWEA